MAEPRSGSLSTGELLRHPGSHIPVRRVTLLLVVATALWPVTPAGSQEVQPRPEIEVTWSLAPRFGLDEDADGLTDFLNTTAYVHNRVTGCRPCPEPRFAVP